MVIRASKSFLNLNARPLINMEEEMRLSVLRHMKAEEDEAMKLKEDDEAMKVEEEDEATKVEEEAAAVEQNGLNGAQFVLEHSMPLSIRTRTVDAGSAQMPPPEPEMYVIREALIAVTKQMFLDDKYGAKASTIRRMVREQLQLPKGFFMRNDWGRRSNIIIFQAFSDARIS
ncbi:hypothetical protein EYC80_010313 [Monilinia laxa]|uniref:Uncharacterized protein n=1 Tax=Monilinia laxa TaxID=61186 RepID=A0A5N6JND1_MONLA|nr:hypothetical protein EYC80_010313 [Monilinia laxa]